MPVLQKVRAVLRQTPLRNAVMAYRHLGLRADDVFLASYPRSGNTWLKSLITTYVSGQPLANFSDRKNTIIPLVGFHGRAPKFVNGEGRLIKTHEAYRKEYQRAIWIIRHPGDVLFSEYKLALRRKLFTGSLDEYTPHFLRRPILAGGNWRDHTLSWAASPICGSQQLLHIRYEDLRLQTQETLIRILLFIGISPSDEKLENVIDQNRIELMATRNATYGQSLGKAIIPGISAFNGGSIDGWRDNLSASSAQMLFDAFGETAASFGYAPGGTGELGKCTLQ